jgi:hypothetical protein
MDIELLATLLLVVLIAVGLALAALYTIRTRGAPPQLPPGAARGRYSHVLAVVVWFIFFGISALLAWGDGASPSGGVDAIVAVALVGVFFAIPVWRAVDRFQGKPWNRRMSADFAVSAATLVFSGWGLIQLAFRDVETLAGRFVYTAFAVGLFALAFPAVIRWFARRAGRVDPPGG